MLQMHSGIISSSTTCRIRSIDELSEQMKSLELYGDFFPARDIFVLNVSFFVTQIFNNRETTVFNHLPEIVNAWLGPPDPVVLHYSIKPNEPPPAVPQAWDIEVKMEDTTLKSKMSHVLVNMSNETSRELAKYDEEVRLILRAYTMQIP